MAEDIELNGMRRGDCEPHHHGHRHGCGRPIVVLEQEMPEDLAAAVKQVQSAAKAVEDMARIKTKGSDGKSTYDLYVEKGGELTLEEWLESLHGRDADIAAAETATTAANEGAAAANAATASAIAAETTRQQTFDTNETARQTAAQNAETFRNGAYEEAENDRDEEFATNEAHREATFNANEAGRTASVQAAQTASQAAATSAQSAADDAAAALQKFNTIKAAIDAIDPQSTEGSIQTLAAKQGVLEAELDQLGPKIDEVGLKTNANIGSDLNIKDENDNVLVRFANGHVETKNFDSSKVNMVSQADNSTADLEIKDESDNVLVRFRKGHIITRKFDSSNISTGNVVLGNDEICDYYGIDSSGSYTLMSDFGCSHYIDCYGVGSITISVPVTTTESGAGIAFYTEAKAFISFTQCPTGASAASTTINVNVPSNAHYFRTTYWNQENSKIYGDFYCKMKRPSSFNGGNARPYQSGNLYFSVEVEQSVESWQSTSQTLGRTLDKKKTTGVLLLPSSYSQTGRKTPLIMYCHGKSHGVYYGTWGSTANFQTQKEHFTARGYAVFDCNGAKDTNRQADGANAFVSSPQNVEAYYKCYRYILEHYNVEDKVCVLGGSLGGPVAVQFSLTRGNCVKALGLLAAYVQLKTLWAGTAGSVFRPYFGVASGDNQGWDENIEKIRPYAPECRMYEVDNTTYFNGMECPVHAWIGQNDASVTVSGTMSFHEQLRGFISALRNSGKTAFIREPQGLAHEIVSGAIQSIDDEVCDWFDMYNLI